MGVWIETLQIFSYLLHFNVTPCMGVWIETFGIAQKYQKARSHPVWVCGLKHLVNNINVTIKRSHPVWVCGLKHGEELMKEIAIGHTLYGCVD